MRPNISRTEPAIPEQIAEEREGSRQSIINPGERGVAELARIADCLECIRRDLRIISERLG